MVDESQSLRIIVKKEPKPLEELKPLEPLSQSRAWQEFLRRPTFQPQPKLGWLGILGLLMLMFLARCLLVGIFVYLGCIVSLFMMAFFSSHSDALFRIGFPAAEKAAIYLSLVGGVVWSAIDICRDFLSTKRQGNFEDREDDEEEDEEE